MLFIRYQMIPFILFYTSQIYLQYYEFEINVSFREN